MAQGKKQREALSSFDRDKQHTAAEALELVKSLARHDVVDVWIEDPPLEEIFLHYYRTDEKVVAR